MLKPVVFIAYARVNLKQAEKLFDFLAQNGCSPWLDKRRLLPGVKWQPAIQAAIQSSDFFLACLSGQSVDRVGYFQSELKDAFDVLQMYPDQNIYLIPVKLEECTLPRQLQDRHWLDFFEPDGPKKLLDAIRSEWRRRGHTNTSSPKSPRPATGSPGQTARPAKLLPNHSFPTVQELKRAISGNELLLCYQPKVALAHPGLLGVEALVRWNHPTRGIVKPSAFIRQMEDAGLIDALTEWVLGEALQQTLKWHCAHLPIPVGVNISGRSLADGTVLKMVERAFAKVAASPSWLNLEITETALVKNVEEIRGQCEALKSLGINLSIDDFGTGYNSLKFLAQRLKLDEMKLDVDFVRDCESDPYKRNIVEGLIKMAHGIGMKVIAEGPESLPTRDYLQARGCDGAQGYYVSQALPAKDLVAWLVNKEWEI
jgi:EAL domain-containing protein (putative c-di-GMP-specific phosphodiesterase class I)